MSTNNYLSYYNSYYGYPSTSGCNPCQTTTCMTPCQPITNTCPNITYINGIASATTIISGGAPIPVGTVIIPGTTTVPAGTVTVINGYTGSPTTNSGCIIQNNGFFTVPTAGQYIITANVCFATSTVVAPTDSRVLYIYRVNAVTGLVTLMAIDSRLPVMGLPTCINLTTTDNFNSNDRIFVASTQLSSTGESVSTIAGTGKISIARVC